MNETYTDMSNKWFELAQETYRTYTKSLLWGQERSLELTRTLIGQADATQNQGKGLVEEYANQFQRTTQLWQQTWQESTRASMDMVNQYRTATNANLAEMTERLDNLTPKVEIATH